MTKPTFSQLCKIAPFLRAIELAIKRVSAEGNPHFCANDAWYRFKPLLLWTVGWDAKGKYPKASEDDQRLIASEEAYDVAYDHLYAILPNCRDCSCL